MARESLAVGGAAPPFELQDQDGKNVSLKEFAGKWVVSTGVLRGAADTRAPMIINVLGFWLLGMPASWFFGFHLGWGPAGLWWGLVVGLAAVALLLLARVAWRLRRGVARLQLS